MFQQHSSELKQVLPGWNWSFACAVQGVGDGVGEGVGVGAEPHMPGPLKKIWTTSSVEAQ